MSADEHARPIHEPSPATAPHALERATSASVEGERRCIACGGHHGGVGEGQRCLESTVRLLRRERADLVDQAARQKKRIDDADLVIARLSERARRLTSELEELRAR